MEGRKEWRVMDALRSFNLTIEVQLKCTRRFLQRDSYVMNSLLKIEKLSNLFSKLRYLSLFFQKLTSVSQLSYSALSHLHYHFLVCFRGQANLSPTSLSYDQKFDIRDCISEIGLLGFQFLQEANSLFISMLCVKSTLLFRTLIQQFIYLGQKTSP